MAPARPRPGVCRSPRPAPPALPCPRPAAPGGISALSAPYVPRRTKFTSPPSPQLPRTEMVVGGGCSGEGCRELHGSRGRARRGRAGDALCFLFRRCRPPHRAPNPSEGSKCLRPPGSGFQSGFSAGERERGNSAGERRTNPPFPPYFCSMSPPRPPSPAPSAPAAPSPRPPGCSALRPPAAARPLAPASTMLPGLPSRPRRRAPRPDPAPAPHTAPGPGPPPAPPAPAAPAPGRAAAEGSGGTAWGAGQGSLAQRRRHRRLGCGEAPLPPHRPDPTRPDPAGSGGHAGGGGSAGGRVYPHYCSREAGPGAAAGAPARPPPPLSPMTRHL